MIRVGIFIYDYIRKTCNMSAEIEKEFGGYHMYPSVLKITTPDIEFVSNEEYVADGVCSMCGHVGTLQTLEATRKDDDNALCYSRLCYTCIMKFLAPLVQWQVIATKTLKKDQKSGSLYHLDFRNRRVVATKEDGTEQERGLRDLFSYSVDRLEKVRKLVKKHLGERKDGHPNS